MLVYTHVHMPRATVRTGILIPSEISDVASRGASTALHSALNSAFMAPSMARPRPPPNGVVDWQAPSSARAPSLIGGLHRFFMGSDGGLGGMEPMQRSIPRYQTYADEYGPYHDEYEPGRSSGARYYGGSNGGNAAVVNPMYKGKQDVHYLPSNDSGMVGAHKATGVLHPMDVPYRAWDLITRGAGDVLYEQLLDWVDGAAADDPLLNIDCSEGRDYFIVEYVLVYRVMVRAMWAINDHDDAMLSSLLRVVEQIEEYLLATNSFRMAREAKVLGGYIRANISPG